MFISSQSFTFACLANYLKQLHICILMIIIRRLDRISNATIYRLTETSPLVEKARAQQLSFLGHILHLPNEEPCKLYALHVPTHGKRKPGGQQTLFLKYIQQLLGVSNDMSQGQLTNMAQDCCSWRKLVVACSAAE